MAEVSEASGKRSVLRSPKIRAGLVSVLAIALTIWSSFYAALNLEIDTDTAEMFARDMPFREHHAAFRRAFPQLEQTLLLVIEGSSPAEVNATADQLRGNLEHDELFSSIDDPRGEAYFVDRGVLFLPLPTVSSLVEQIERARPLIETLSSHPTVPGLVTFLESAVRLSSLSPDPRVAAGLSSLIDPLATAISRATDGEDAPIDWRGVLLSGDLAPRSSRRVITCQPRLDYDALLPAERAMNRVRSWIDELDASNGVRVRVTGEVALLHEELVSSETGVERSAVLSFLLVAILLRLALGSWRLVTISLVALIIGLSWTAAFAALTVGRLNLISIAFAVLYISLGVDGSIHFCARYRELAKDGRDRLDRLLRTIREIGISLLLAALTTAFGFLAFVPTSFDAVAELGLIASGGIFISLLINVTLLPALILLFGGGERPPREGRRPWEEILAGPVLRHRRLVRWLSALFAVAGTVICFQATFDPDPHRLRDPRSESVSTFDALAEDPETTPLRAHLLAESPAELEAKVRSLEALPEVASVLTIEDLVPTDQSEKIARLSSLALLPAMKPEAVQIESPTRVLESLARLEGALPLEGDLAPAAARLRRAQERFREPAAPEDDSRRMRRLQASLLGGLPTLFEELARLTGQREVGPADIPAGIRNRWRSARGTFRLDVIPSSSLDDPASLDAFVRAVQSVDPSATGAPVISRDAGRLAVDAFQRAFLFAFAANLIVLILIFRRPLDVLAVLTPLVLGGILTGALAVLIGLRFNFANVIALPLLLGLGIDNGIHMVHRHRLGLSGDRSLLRTSTSRAVLFSSLTTIGGFGSLALSPHVGTASLGLLLAIGIGSVLLSTMVVLPVLPLSGTKPAGAPNP